MSRQPVSTEGRFEIISKTTKNKDKLLEYRKVLPAMLQYGTGATPTITKCILSELANEKTPMLVKYIASQALYSLPESKFQLNGSETDIFLIFYYLRKGVSVSTIIQPTKLISMMATENKLFSHLLIPSIFNICCRDKVSDQELMQVDTLITRYLQMVVKNGQLEFNPHKLPVKIQETDGKVSNTQYFTVMNISERNIYTLNMSQHQQIVSNLIQYISIVTKDVKLCQTIIQYVNFVFQQMLRVQKLTNSYATIYHEMIRLLGIIATKFPETSTSIVNVLSSIRTQAEHINPFVSLSLLDATLSIKTDLIEGNVQKVNSFIQEFLVQNDGFADSLLVSETLRIIKKHTKVFSNEHIFFPFTAIAMHSTAIQRDILPLLYLFISNGQAAGVLNRILDLPLFALLLTLSPPNGEKEQNKRTESMYQFAYNYMYKNSYEEMNIWKNENKVKLDELMKKSERFSGRVKSVLKCVPALLRVFFQALSVRYCSESEALKIVKEIITRYDLLFNDVEYKKLVRETFVSGLSILTKNIPCVLSVLVAAFHGLYTQPNFADDIQKISFASNLCYIIGENAHLIKQSEVEFLLAEIDPQTFEDSNYNEYLQITLLSLYCKLGQAIGQNSKVKLTLAKLINKVGEYPMLSMRVQELYALFATPGLAENTLKSLQFEYVDADAPLPALVSIPNASEVHPLHPFTLYADEIQPQKEAEEN